MLDQILAVLDRNKPWKVFRHGSSFINLLKVLGAWPKIVGLVAIIAGAIMGYLTALPVWGKILVGLGVATMMSATTLFVTITWAVAKGKAIAPEALDGGNPTEGRCSLPTLKELFETDWPELPAFYHVATVESDGLKSRKVAVAWRLEGDFAARSKFLAFWLEPAIPPEDALKICHHIASNCQHFIDTADSEVDIAGKAPGDTLATHLKDMAFSKRVFIYYEHPDFSLEHKGQLEGAYRNAGFSVQFRDSAYAWLHRDDKITVRPVPLKPNTTLLPNARSNDGLMITVTALREHSMPPSNPPGDSLGSQSPESTTHDCSSLLPSLE